MKLLKSKPVIALVIAVLVVLIWAYWRSAHTSALKTELGAQYSYNPVDWRDGTKWDNYEPLSFELPQ